MIFNYDKLVVGSTLSALLYSYINHVPVVFVEKAAPLAHDLFEERVDLSYFKLKCDEVKILSPTCETIKYSGKQCLFDHLAYCLSLAGLIPFSTNLTGIRLDSDNTIRVSTRTCSYTVGFNELLIFNRHDISGLPVTERKKKKPLILDFMRVEYIKKTNPYQLWETDEDFLKRIWFMEYGKAVGESYLTEKQSQSFDYSNFYIKKKLRYVADELSIKSHFAKKRATFIPEERKIINRDEETFDLPENISFPLLKEETLCQLSPLQESFLSRIAKNNLDSLGMMP